MIMMMVVMMTLLVPAFLVRVLRFKVQVLQKYSFYFLKNAIKLSSSSALLFFMGRPLMNTYA